VAREARWSYKSGAMTCAGRKQLRRVSNGPSTLLAAGFCRMTAISPLSPSLCSIATERAGGVEQRTATFHAGAATAARTAQRAGPAYS
jgi:hypothetical protein